MTYGRWYGRGHCASMTALRALEVGLPSRHACFLDLNLRNMTLKACKRCKASWCDERRLFMCRFKFQVSITISTVREFQSTLIERLRSDARMIVNGNGIEDSALWCMGTNRARRGIFLCAVFPRRRIFSSLRNSPITTLGLQSWHPRKVKATCNLSCKIHHLQLDSLYQHIMRVFIPMIY